MQKRTTHTAQERYQFKTKQKTLHFFLSGYIVSWADWTKSQIRCLIM